MFFHFDGSDHIFELMTGLWEIFLWICAFKRIWPIYVFCELYLRLFIVSVASQILHESFPTLRKSSEEVFRKGMGFFLNTQNHIIEGKIGNQIMDGEDEAWVLLNRRESTASSMFSGNRVTLGVLHGSQLALDKWAGSPCPALGLSCG